jgi:hypothetical protein
MAAATVLEQLRFAENVTLSFQIFGIDPVRRQASWRAKDLLTWFLQFVRGLRDSRVRRRLLLSAHDPAEAAETIRDVTETLVNAATSRAPSSSPTTRTWYTFTSLPEFDRDFKLKQVVPTLFKMDGDVAKHLSTFLTADILQEARETGIITDADLFKAVEKGNFAGLRQAIHAGVKPKSGSLLRHVISNLDFSDHTIGVLCTSSISLPALPSSHRLTSQLYSRTSNVTPRKFGIRNPGTADRCADQCKLVTRRVHRPEWS